MKKINTRAMVEGGILAALTAILGIFYNMPVVGALTMLWPVPIIIVGYRNGFRVSVIAAIIAAILISLMASPIVGLTLFITYAAPGVVMGYMMRKHLSPNVTLIACGIILAFTAVLEFILNFELLSGMSFFNIISNFDSVMSSIFGQINSQFAEAAEIYRRFGLDETTIKQAMDMMDEMLKQLKLLLPAGFLFTGIMLSFINFKAVKVILERIGYKVEDVKNFSQWQLSRGYRYFILSMTFLVLLLASFKLSYLDGLILNLWLILQIIYMIIGLSITAYFAERFASKHEMPRPAQVLMLIFLTFIFIGVMPYVGIFDMVADIRRFDRNILGGVQ